VYGASERRARARFDVPEHPFTAPAGDAAAVARGRRLATVRGCAGCHGFGLAGRVELDNPLIGRLAGPNLTRGGRGAELTDADWERAVRHGVRRDGTPLFVMPAGEHNGMSDEDLGAIAPTRAACRAPRPAAAVAAGPVLRAMQASGQVNVYSAAEIDHRRPHPARVAAEPTAAYGAYLATMCTGCHGQRFGGGKIPAPRPTGSPPPTSPPPASATTPRPTSPAPCARAAAPAAPPSTRPCPCASPAR
jgi:cytochrome c553